MTLSDSGWAHRHRERWRETLNFECGSCHAKPGQMCRMFVIPQQDRTRPHVSRWRKLRAKEEPSESE